MMQQLEWLQKINIYPRIGAAILHPGTVGQIVASNKHKFDRAWNIARIFGIGTSAEYQLAMLEHIKRHAKSLNSDTSLIIA